MQCHGSCVARSGAAVLIMGPPGSGKSDLALRLLDHGFTLIADDQVLVNRGLARAPSTLRGLLEVRGLGIVRLRHDDSARVRLLVRLHDGAPAERLPRPQIDEGLSVPVIGIDPWQASAVQRVILALDCVLGTVVQLAGSFKA